MEMNFHFQSSFSHELKFFQKYCLGSNLTTGVMVLLFSDEMRRNLVSGTLQVQK